MITLSLLIAACFSLVSPQLALAQHTALMQLYDALGSATVFEKVFFFFFLIFCFSLSFRLSSCVVSALRGECHVLWRSFEMFWEQRDCCVRLEVCLVRCLMFRRFCRYLDGNQLTGTIPITVGQLSWLTDL
jgi:hypothetical protein